MRSQLIVMLTQNDLTVTNAEEIYENCKTSKAKIWGFKEQGLSDEKMRRLFKRMKDDGNTIALEVVDYSEEGGLEGARKAFDCGCDLLMGTKYHDSIHNYCQSHQIHYMPFVGEVVGRPSILKGCIDGILEEAKKIIHKGVFGIDLLGYRFEGDREDLIKRFIDEIHAPVCIAGSIDSFQRLNEIKEASPDYFTIGSAFFEQKFGVGFLNQIHNVFECLESDKCYV
ncbi:MAG: hypothetical protein MI717_08310 [Spirochaetales bacterium]|nr:hypothetical protein [Spirochaetales bacterium]